ncbi:hypothetical protein Tsp_05512 [Trichinella spiralis]|uniref:hypothetical protein n=1 Tax=Trichinella spiralis TaxID=6334 RepID=UPI0001EFDB9A|nr:hypothetical protein Tsp_05512 [Trichinella spiralis]
MSGDEISTGRSTGPFLGLHQNVRDDCGGVGLLQSSASNRRWAFIRTFSGPLILFNGSAEMTTLFYRWSPLNLSTFLFGKSNGQMTTPNRDMGGGEGRGKETKPDVDREKHLPPGVFLVTQPPLM